MFRLLSVFLWIISCSAMAQQEWRLWRDKDNVKVYQRKAEHGLIEIRATTSISSRLSAFIALLHDTENVPLWMANVTQVTELSRPSEFENIVHTVIDTPWPVQDRDMVTYSRYWQDEDGRLMLEVSDRHDALPKQQRIVRMQNVAATWTLTPQHNGEIFIHYQAMSQSSGSLPVWISNRATLKAIQGTFRAMRRHIVLPKYQNAAMPGIRELTPVPPSQ